MLQPLLNATTVPLLERLAVFGERRQQVLAGNIANIDTPGYRTRDLPLDAFQHALREAVAARHQAPPVVSEALAPPGEAAVRPTVTALDELFPETLYQAAEVSPRSLTFQDANNRDIETEVANLTKNLLTQNVAIELLMSQLNQLQMVISERV